MKIGLKLWSNNKNYIRSAEELYADKVFDYIELYAVKETFSEYAALWKKLEIPYIIHAAHYHHGMNLAVPEKEEANKRLFNEAAAYADLLKAPHIIVHPGVLGSHDEVSRQVKGLSDKRILIENKPYIALNREICAGHSPEQVKEILCASKAGFCLDINHAYNYACNAKKGYLDVIHSFMELSPIVAHLSGIDVNSEVDVHLHLRDSGFPLGDVLGSLFSEGSIEYLTIETPKDTGDDLDDFLEDISDLGKLAKKAGVR